MKCPHCQTDNPAHVNFCTQCGTALRTSCPNCGKQVSCEMKFCIECGHPLQGTLPPQARQRVYILCPNCRFANRAGIHFCENCGIQISLEPNIYRSKGKVRTLSTGKIIGQSILRFFGGGLLSFITSKLGILALNYILGSQQ